MHIPISSLQLPQTMKLHVVIIMWWAVFLTTTFPGSSSSDDAETYNLLNAANLTKPGCESRCGDLIVPYPFGILDSVNPNCSLNKWFDIYCDKSSSPPKAYFAEGDYIWIKNISDSTVRTSNGIASQCSFPNQDPISYNLTSGYRPSMTFSQVNKFTVIGCNGYAWLTSARKDRNVSTGCMVFCSTPEEVAGDGDCSGNGCCQSDLPQDIAYYETEVESLQNANDTSSFAPCAYAFVGDANVFNFTGITDLTAVDVNDMTSVIDRIESSVPIVLDWAIGNLSCAEAQTSANYTCQPNSTCVNSPRKVGGGYRCACKEGYHGNPYLSPGCQDIDECLDTENSPCSRNAICTNTPGNYTCTCNEGFIGEARSKDGCQLKPLTSKPFYELRLPLGLGLGFLTLLIGLAALHIIIKQKKLIKLKEKFFEQNGGILLEDKLKRTGHIIMKIFQIEELEKATDKYSEENILGRGGNGIVYKGILPDMRIVAIKKSQRLDQGQRDQFINEMMILAQIEHPNVVQLLGCCLETDVPLLVYEYVCNDTLHRHIHNRASENRRLSWESRLRIAHESAGALAYLHTETRMSIIHRDVKSTNILLDENYTSKIADFGASRLVPLGHDQVTTLVQGTIGYLDPEYFHTGHLTGESDVYSFGVVLAELLTSKRPIDNKRGLKDTNLTTCFLNAKKENRLLDVLDPQVVKEASDEQLEAACDLVCRCVNQVGMNRPSMKDVTKELETMRKSAKQHPWFSKEKYTETSSLMIEIEERDLYTVASNDSFGAYGSSTTGPKEIMPHHIQGPR